MSRWRRLLVLGSTLPALLPGCLGAESARSGWNVCSNPELGFSIEYPPGWYTTHLEPRTACLFFDERPFTVPPASELLGNGLAVLPQAQQPFEDVVTGYTDKRFARVLAREDTEVAGLRAVRLETEATGEGLADRGTLETSYVVERDGSAWIVQTSSAPGRDYEARQEILDRAAATLRFD